MSKAEDFATKKYPISIENIHGHKVDVNLWQRKACVEGYHQAEKDLELTWKDMKLIWNITDELENMPEEEFYKEVLKRFKAQKGE